MLCLQFLDGTLLVPFKNQQTNVFRTDFLKNTLYFIKFPKKPVGKMLFLWFSDGTRLVPSNNRQINVFWTDFLIFPYNSIRTI